MPLLHSSARAGRRVLAGGLLTAVAVLGTPAIASAEGPDLGDVGTAVEGALDGTDTGTDTDTDTDTDTGAGVPAAPGPEDLEAGAACVAGLVEGIQVSIGEIVGGLTGILVGLSGGDSTTVTPGAVTAATIPMTPEELLSFLSPEQLEGLLAGGQESLTVGIPLVVDGVTSLVPVVFDFVSCLADLLPELPAAAPTTTVSPAAPTTTTAAPDASVTTSAAPVAAVAYPGYAPTGGAPTEGTSSAPLVLAGLGLLTAAAGGVAHHLRARRGVTD